MIIVEIIVVESGKRYKTDINKNWQKAMDVQKALVMKVSCKNIALSNEDHVVLYRPLRGYEKKSP